MARKVLVALSFLFISQAYSEDERRPEISNALALKAMRDNITSIVNPVRKCTESKTDATSQAVLTKASVFNNAVAAATKGCTKYTIGTDGCKNLIMAAVGPLNDLWPVAEKLKCGTTLVYNSYTNYWKQPKSGAPATDEKTAKAPATKPTAAAPSAESREKLVGGRTAAQELQSFNNMIAMIKKKNGKFATPEIAAHADLLLGMEKNVNSKCNNPKTAADCIKLLNASKQPFYDYATLTKAQLKVVVPKK